jgi:hypothetical protein
VIAWWSVQRFSALGEPTMQLSTHGANALVQPSWHESPSGAARSAWMAVVSCGPPRRADIRRSTLLPHDPIERSVDAHERRFHRRRGSMSDQSTMTTGCLIPVSKVRAIAR